MPPAPNRMLVSLPDGYHLYGFLNTGLARRLSGEADVTFIVPQGALRSIEPETADSAEWVEFPMRRIPVVSRACKHVRLEASHHLRRASSWDIVRSRSVRGRLRGAVQNGLGRALAAWPRLEQGLSAVEGLLVRSPLPAAVDVHRYRTVVFGSSGIKDLDMAAMRSLRRMNLRRYGIVYSWDNLSSKFNSFSRLDRMAVWNGIMRDEAVESLGFPPERIAVVGPSQFDCYHDYRPPRPRASFLAAHGLPQGARYILYAGVNSAGTPWNVEYAECVLEAQPDRHVLVRTHPQDHPAVYARLEGRPRVGLFASGAAGEAGERRLGYWIPRPDEGALLAEQIHHADAVVTVASTITLEGLRLGRPVINIAFDVAPDRFPVSMSRYYETEHYRVVTASGAVEIVRSREELARALRGIDTWWPDRRRNAESLNRQIDPFEDGRATERLAQDILAFHGGGDYHQERA